MRRLAVVMGLLGILGASLLVSRLLVEHDFDPSATVKFATVASEQNVYASELLGRDIVIAPMAGHDGKFFFSQAMDPFYLEPDVHADHLDRPTYRAQRMFYPTLASLGGLLPAEATLWGLIVVNVLAMGIGTAFTSLVAVEMGVSKWFGLAFLLNPAMIVTLNIDGAEIVAMAGMMAAVYYTMRENYIPAAVSLTVACLAREVMLIAAVGLGLFVLYKRRRRVSWLYAKPFLAVGGWWLYVRWRLDASLNQDMKDLDVPFTGFVHAVQAWFGNIPVSLPDLMMGLVLLVVSVLVVIRAFRSPSALAWAASGFALLGIILSIRVWRNYFDSSRALAPVLTAYLIMAAPAYARPTTKQARDREEADSNMQKTQ